MAILLWMAAAAANAAATGQVAPPPKVADGDRIVCKSQRFVGSHLGQRVCKPKSDWDAGRKDAKDALDQRQLRVNKPEEGPN